MLTSWAGSGGSRRICSTRILANWLKQHSLDQRIADLPRTHAVFASSRCLLFGLNGQVRGRILGAAARERDRSLHPSCRVVGAQDTLKLQGDAPFDWLRVDGRGIETRVKHKSALMSWDKSGKRWTAAFAGIEIDQHDELQLTLVTPAGVLCFIQSDSAWPIVGKTCGRKGRNIRLVGPSGEFDVDSALQKMVTKVGAVSSVFTYPHDDPILKWAAASCASRTHEIYAALGCPFNGLDIRSRGMLFEAIARTRDAERHIESHVDHADVCFGADGRQLHASIRKYDWKRTHRHSRSHVRVEHKSAQVTWDSTNRLWRAIWKGVVPDNHDELQLTLYSPNALRTFIHDGSTGLSGRSSKRDVAFSGPKGEHDIHLSMSVLLHKLVVAFGSPVTEYL
ncbi:unnamed protein product [Prorocentrum cordatum]|uniref:Uncharacterized protein n=1 Tax=Prorocentrum cordatum TaxID=2364126 RepID=A0ABN9QZ79_9DINO|nr:unnamed protein product [Polarella glacialis]